MSFGLLALSLACIASGQVYAPPPLYDRYIRPTAAVENDPNAPPEKIEVQINLENVFSVSMQGVMSVRLRIIEKWTDPRLNNIPNDDPYFRIQAGTNQIWNPSGRILHIIDVTTEGERLYVMQEGTVVKLHFINLEIKCEFYFRWLPFDWQECKIPYVETMYHFDEIELIPIEFIVDDDVSIAEWDIIDNYIDPNPMSFSNNYFDKERPGVEATIVLQRRIEYYTRFVFVPSILLVCISYSSFYITHKATPARTLLGVVPILTSLTTLAANMAQMPKFSYESWLIVFLFTNTIFNVVTMLEFAFIAYIDHTYGDKKENALNEQMQNLGIQMNVQDLLNPNKEKDAEEDPTCICFKRLFQSGKNQVNVWEKVCNCVYRALRKYFDKSPKVIDKLFRLFFMVAYLMVLGILFLLPISASYDG